MQQYSGQHDLIWNGSASRQREKPGRIQCRRCGKTWPCDNSHNMQRALCPARTPAEIPNGWLSMQYALSNSDAAVQFLISLSSILIASLITFSIKS